jgi:uncharacterized protein (TIGR00251 family)
VLFPVRVLPGASRTEIAGSEGGILEVRVAAPPIKDKANKALVKLLAKTLGVPNSQVEIIAGHATRRKTVRVHGAKAAAIADLLRPATTSGVGHERC